MEIQAYKYELRTLPEEIHISIFYLSSNHNPIALKIPGWVQQKIKTCGVSMRMIPEECCVIFPHSPLEIKKIFYPLDVQGLSLRKLLTKIFMVEGCSGEIILLITLNLPCKENKKVVYYNLSPEKFLELGIPFILIGEIRDPSLEKLLKRYPTKARHFFSERYLHPSLWESFKNSTKDYPWKDYMDCLLGIWDLF